MARKKITSTDISETTGPMNDVAKDDALVYANAPPVKHLSKLEPRKEREVRAKKQKIKNSSKKADRRINQALKRYDPDQKD